MLTATLLSLAVIAAPQAAGKNDAPIQADVVIRGATLVDGTGKPSRFGDLAIRGDKIVAVGTFTVAGKPRILDATGLVIAPGFIDLHTHSDIPLTQKATSANLNYLMQGVTTAVTGNCGAGPTDVVLGYRSARLIKALAERSHARLRVVDDRSAYYRLKAKEMTPPALYEALRRLFQVGDAST